ncbi:hypothetical protein Nepgr_006780 [Nepenthes gracilis]|uniref:Uncharacterized protein n=1 Tax=Nepenthes gracilis TaxID=150966 RepID=A0AAD3S623_NEPGR|nr:hypothetical protein Nepgr_006780 [Nepenthes gracilis]
MAASSINDSFFGPLPPLAIPDVRFREIVSAVIPGEPRGGISYRILVEVPTNYMLDSSRGALQPSLSTPLASDQVGRSSHPILSSSIASIAPDGAFLASIQSQGGCDHSSLVASIPEPRSLADDSILVPICGGSPVCSGSSPCSEGPSGLLVRNLAFGPVSSSGGLVESPSVVSNANLSQDLSGLCTGAPEPYRALGSSRPDTLGPPQLKGSWASIVEKRAFGVVVILNIGSALLKLLAFGPVLWRGSTGFMQLAALAIG